MMNIFRISDFFVLMLLCQKIFAFTYTSKDGVKLDYTFRFKPSCRGEKDRIGILPGIALPECVKECGMRPNCGALNYKRRYNACYLYSSEENEGDRSKESCVEVKASDIEIIQKPPTCANCDQSDKTCIPSEQTCKHTECLQNKPPPNGKFLGNMKSIGDRIQYECDFGYKIVDGMEYAVCLSNGNWNVTAVDKCTKIDETNVALRKTTAMSGVWNNHSGEKGVDGNTIQDLSGRSCFLTSSVNRPWWRVDLGAIFGIVRVELYNNLDNCCNWMTKDLKLSFGTSLQSMDVVGSVSGRIDDIHTFNFTLALAIEARYVQVHLKGMGTLTLCEMEVLGFPIY
ncbi:uncharacterized protein LOC123542151 [Mercenaria mercenaria]|uniref:uncharacterized protein LOC123542151 n=1 Tax=Mercenaria mercenaria TaxID=6596 RepID=UPI00234ECC6A|nr:uncharacterized protein LOC123542151 [Mercenaria mercenaria]